MYKSIHHVRSMNICMTGRKVGSSIVSSIHDFHQYILVYSGGTVARYVYNVACLRLILLIWNGEKIGKEIETFCATLALNIFYSGIEYTEKDCVRLKVQHYSFQTLLFSDS